MQNVFGFIKVYIPKKTCQAEYERKYQMYIVECLKIIFEISPTINFLVTSYRKEKQLVV